MKTGDKEYWTIEDIDSHAQQLAMQSKYSTESIISWVASLWKDGEDIGEAFAIVEAQLKEETAKGW